MPCLTPCPVGHLLSVLHVLSPLWQQVDITQVGLAQYDLHCICVQRPAHQVRPRSIARRLARPATSYQAGIVDNVRQQEDPVVRWPSKYACTDAICRNVITPLAHRFQTHGIR